MRRKDLWLSVVLFGAILKLIVSLISPSPVATASEGSDDRPPIIVR